MVCLCSNRTVSKTLGQHSGARDRGGESWDHEIRGEPASSPLEVFPSVVSSGSWTDRCQPQREFLPFHVLAIAFWQHAPGSTGNIQVHSLPRVHSIFNYHIMRLRTSRDLGIQLYPLLVFFMPENTGSERLTDLFISQNFRGISLFP